MGRMIAGMVGLALAAAALNAAPAMAQRGPVNASAPAGQGTAQRAAILAALRPAIENRLGPNVEFVVSRIVVSNGWALVVADPQRRGGGRIDPSRHFAADDLEFMDGITVNGVLRNTGRGWTLVDHAIGPTDVWYCGVRGIPRRAFNC